MNVIYSVMASSFPASSGSPVGGAWQSPYGFEIASGYALAMTKELPPRTSSPEENDHFTESIVE